MAIAVQGNKIDDTDYATDLYTAINNLLGPTTAGYGQTLTLSSVSAGSKITALQFTQAYTDIIRIARHQGTQANTEISTLPTISSGSKISATDVKKYQDAVTYLADVSRRYVVASPEFSIEAISSSTRTATWGSSSNAQVGHEFTIEFSTTNDLRYFFNSGGQIRFVASRTGTTGGQTAQNNSWTSLLSSIGTVVFNYTTASGSSGSNLGIGGLELTTSFQTIFTISPASTYTVNDYTIRAKTNAGYTAIDFQVLFNDDSKNATTFDAVGGTLTSTVDSVRPTGSYVQVNAPTLTTPITRALTVNGIVNGSTGGGGGGGGGPPTYEFATPFPTSMNEGATQSFTVNTTNVANGTILNWEIQPYLIYGTNAQSSDFDITYGSFTISSNTGSFNVTTTTAGGPSEALDPEYFTIRIKASGTLVLVSNNIYINNTTP